VKKTYFASDFHLGLDAGTTSADRELKIVRWLESIRVDAEALYLVGDIFDHWFEYRSSIPKGYVRFLGKLAELKDQGIDIYFFTGNHDMWMFRYLTDYLGIPIYRDPIERVIGAHRFVIGHGDGLGPGDHSYKVIKSIFNNKICQRLFSILHPTLGLAIMRYFSVKERLYPGTQEPIIDYHKEFLVQYCERDHRIRPDVDFYLFGHRHLPIQYKVSTGKAIYYNLGEWMYACSYVVYDGKSLQLRFFDSSYHKVF
jgi:UDP-2,3-diacylglucosamine hydrolase